METGLVQIIDNLRQQMVEIAMERGSFVDEQVVAISQQLDFFIYQQQLIQDRNRRQYMYGLYSLLAKHEQVYAVS